MKNSEEQKKENCSRNSRSVGDTHLTMQGLVMLSRLSPNLPDMVSLLEMSMLK